MDFTSHLERSDKPYLKKWIQDCLLHNHTAPLARSTMLMPPSQLIIMIYNTSNDYVEFKPVIKSCIEEIYNDFSSNNLFNNSFFELMIIIGNLNVSNLFPTLLRDARLGLYKNIEIENYPKIIDFHTVLLKALFALSIDNNKKVMTSLKRIILRDISNKKYMLECFNALYLMPGGINLANKNISLLLSQDDERDFIGAIQDYFMTLGLNEINASILKSYDPIHIQKIISIIFNINYKIHAQNDNEIGCFWRGDMKKIHKRRKSFRIFKKISKKFEIESERRYYHMSHDEIVKRITHMNN